MKKAILTATAAAFALAPAALADGHGDKFSAIDSNGDATISEAEFVAYATVDGETTGDEASLQFAVLAGSDGVLTREEFDAVMGTKDDAAGDDADGDMSSADPAETSGE